MSSINCGWMPKRDAVSRSMVSVSVVPSVCWSVATSRSSRQRLHPGQNLRHPFVQLVELCILQRVFELRPRGAAAQPDVLGRLHVETCSLDRLELRPQPRDDLLRIRVALLARLQRDVHATRIQRGAAADELGHALHRGIGPNDPAEFFLVPLHVGERDILGHLRHRVQEAIVLLREDPFGMIRNR
ncbi:hypothetical protein ACVMIH_003709 [Bradyrhizobium sp. USDA 4503]